MLRSIFTCFKYANICVHDEYKHNLGDQLVMACETCSLAKSRNIQRYTVKYYDLTKLTFNPFATGEHLPA